MVVAHDRLCVLFAFQFLDRNAQLHNLGIFEPILSGHVRKEVFRLH